MLFWIVAAAIALPPYAMIALVAYHVERRVVRTAFGEDEEVLYAVFWPVRLACLLILVALGIPVVGAMWLGGLVARGFMATNGHVDRMAERLAGWQPAGNPDPAAVSGPPPRISIPDGAAIGSGEYRKLKPMIEKYEERIPVTERE